MSDNLCVYTCLYGNYEKLPEQTIARETSVPFYCFTDNPNLESQTWQIIYREPIFKLDPVRSQRLIKINPPEIIKNYNYSIYIDTSYKLLKDPKELLEAFFPASGISLFPHEFRESVNDEFMAVISENLDDHNKVYEQYHHYMAAYPNALLEIPFHTAMILRESKNARVIDVMETWAGHVSRYSRRDQLSINIVLNQLNFVPDTFELDLYKSNFIKYNMARKINRNLGIRNPITSIMPAIISEYLTLRIHDSKRTEIKQGSRPKEKIEVKVRFRIRLKIFLLRYKLFQLIRNFLLTYLPRVAEKLKER